MYPYTIRHYTKDTLNDYVANPMIMGSISQLIAKQLFDNELKPSYTNVEKMLNTFGYSQYLDKIQCIIRLTKRSMLRIMGMGGIEPEFMVLTIQQVDKFMLYFPVIEKICGTKGLCPKSQGLIDIACQESGVPLCMLPAKLLSQRIKMQIHLSDQILNEALDTYWSENKINHSENENENINQRHSENENENENVNENVNVNVNENENENVNVNVSDNLVWNDIGIIYEAVAK